MHVCRFYFEEWPRNVIKSLFRKEILVNTRNVPGMFFITSGVSLFMNGKRRETPVTPPERELQ